MPTTNPRINVTFSKSDAECLKLISKRKEMSMSNVVRKVVEDWLEEYEDMLLARRAEEAEARWIADGCKTISHEDLCRELGLESNIPKKPEPVLKSSPKTSRKGSKTPLKKGSLSRRKKSASRS